jgi:hypothetical protein
MYAVFAFTFASAAMALGYLAVPVEARSGQELRAAVVDARGHAITVKLNLVQPLRSGWRLLDRLRKLGRDEGRQRDVVARSTGFDGMWGGTLDDTRHSWNSTGTAGPQRSYLE